MPRSSLRKEVLRHVPEIPETDVSFFFNPAGDMDPQVEKAFIGIEKWYDYLDDNPKANIYIREPGTQVYMNHTGWNQKDVVLHTHRQTELYEEYVKMYLVPSVTDTGSKMSRLNSAECLWSHKRGSTEFRHALFIADFTYGHSKDIFYYAGIRTEKQNTLTLRQFGILPATFYVVRPEYEFWFPHPGVTVSDFFPGTDSGIRRLHTSLDWNSLVSGVSSDKPLDSVYKI
jgi:hypothetical protein